MPNSQNISKGSAGSKIDNKTNKKYAIFVDQQDKLCSAGQVPTVSTADKEWGKNERHIKTISIDNNEAALWVPNRTR